MADATEASPRRAYLNSQEDWDTWFMLFRAMAKAKDVWEFVDPKGIAVLVQPTQPVKPTPTPTSTPTSDGSTVYSFKNTS